MGRGPLSLCAHSRTEKEKAAARWATALFRDIAVPAKGLALIEIDATEPDVVSRADELFPRTKFVNRKYREVEKIFNGDFLSCALFSRLVPGQPETRSWRLKQSEQNFQIGLRLPWC